MNLGDYNVQYVNRSRPQLVHTPSKQSVTASDDYYSLASEGSSNDERNQAPRYQTPPTHLRSADVSRDALQSEAKESEATIPQIRPVKPRDPPDIPPPIDTSSDGIHKIKRKPVSSSSSEGTIVRRPVSESISPPTPGIDDTPYIRFAIDQLTRDEEVVGPREQGTGRETPGYPVDRIMPEQAPSYNLSKAQGQYPNPDRRRQDSSPSENVLLSIDPTHDGFKYPRLNFVPRALRILPLAILLLCCALIIAGLLFCAIYPTTHTGLWQYDGVGTARYFVFQYLPTIIASLVIIWTMAIQCAIHRISPFIVLASSRRTSNSGVLYDMTIFPTNYLIPNLTFFKNQEHLLGLCSIIFWLALFTVPLQSCLFQTRYYLSGSVWRWTAVQPVAWTLFALYLLLAIAIVLLVIRLAACKTGLKWDPVSLADLFCLFHKSNILTDFERSEVGVDRIRHLVVEKHLQLGYWGTSEHSMAAFYGVGEANAPVRRFSFDRGKMVPVTDLSRPEYDPEGQRPLHSSKFDTLQRDIHSPDVRYRWLPWFLREGVVTAWIITAIVLMIAFIVVSFVGHAVQRGFQPMLAAPTTAQGFSPANFLYSFIPSSIGMVLFLLWHPVDMYFRALQPFANLAHTRGCSAERSLLLDYTSRLPIEITIRAALERHFKVAWISFISILSITLPILAGGVFTAQFVADIDDVRMAADMPGYYALVVFVVIYALSTVVIWPGRNRELPHDISTVSHLISFVYQSPILIDAAFREPTSKVDLQTRLIGTLTGEKGRARYGFGVYAGRDGKDHLGIDQISRPGSGEMVITIGSSKR
ncbi:hypothetical protein MMC21_002176 [Puttea exsequens]|nr:hypothetical protein [Puttea exsequens]